MPERPSWIPHGVDITQANVSRIYDYFLGGSHNFAVDREAARAAIRSMPGIPAIARANRAAMQRALRFAMERGITQFLDVGSGIPTFGSVHEVVRARRPGSRVVYIDNDPVAVAHSRAVLADDPDAAVAAADLRDPAGLLGRPEVRALDFERPVALLLVAVVHFLSDADGPAGIIAALRDALAPGSVLVITHATLDHGPAPDGQRAVQDVYDRTPTPLVMRTVAQMRPLFSGFDVVEPGIVPLPHWRPNAPDEPFDRVELHGLVGVGVKP
ncbi:SAM-dependent methyltransferase [Streptomyces sp. 8L]|uniref:SAM-dependent methyltransferase n=1 Tax=Streptomyces sp. 8L TaxID=2877242 RepID=UPI001CD2D527|nr:SAM-dependent methyltransferase [Streptomyces sp. 8L]MCA1221516.1 SAM-dependent methyltransferase [Streptomyces sp. 8L]